MRYVVGIDEAGRGPVLGPMVYGIAAYPAELHGRLRAYGADDSKKLTPERRASIMRGLSSLENFYSETISVSAREISEKMLRPTKVSLNDLAFQAARQLLVNFAKRFDIEHAYIDLISPAAQYEAFIRQALPGLKMTIAAKADSTYPITGAASICAKTVRDGQIGQGWGCGYPGDEVTIVWLNAHLDRVYGFPDNVRVSWKTAEKIIEEKCAKCVFFSQQKRDESLSRQEAQNVQLGVWGRARR